MFQLHNATTPQLRPIFLKPRGDLDTEGMLLYCKISLYTGTEIKAISLRPHIHGQFL